MAATGKTFYLETFGCQMNAHDSEKVVGTLISEGYRQVETVEEAGLVLYNTCSIRDKAEQKVFHRLADYKKLQKKARSLVFSGVSPNRKATRSSSAPRTFRWFAGQRRTPNCLRCWHNWKPASVMLRARSLGRLVKTPAFGM